MLSRMVTTRPDSVSKPRPARAVDLDLRVKTIRVSGELALEYQLYSPSGAAGTFYETIRSEPLENPHGFKAWIYSQLASLHCGSTVDGQPILARDINRELESLGHLLYKVGIALTVTVGLRRHAHLRASTGLSPVGIALTVTVGLRRTQRRPHEYLQT
jgi:hypothetical protein